MMTWRRSKRGEGARGIGAAIEYLARLSAGGGMPPAGKPLIAQTGANNDPNYDHCIDDPRPCADGLDDLGFALPGGEVRLGEDCYWLPVRLGARWRGLKSAKQKGHAPGHGPQCCP